MGRESLWAEARNFLHFDLVSDCKLSIHMGSPGYYPRSRNLGVIDEKNASKEHENLSVRERSGGWGSPLQWLYLTEHWKCLLSFLIFSYLLRYFCFPLFTVVLTMTIELTWVSKIGLLGSIPKDFPVATPHHWHQKWSVWVVAVTHVFGKYSIIQLINMFFTTYPNLNFISKYWRYYTYNISWWSSGSHGTCRSLLTLK